MNSGSTFPSPPSSVSDLVLGIAGFEWKDLFEPERLAELHAIFLRELAASAPEVHDRLEAYRAFANGASSAPPLSAQDISDVLVATSPYVSAFLARLFRVEEEKGKAQAFATGLMPVWKMKQDFVRRRAVKRGAVAFDAGTDALARAALAGGGVRHADNEMQVAAVVSVLLEAEAALRRGEAAPESAESALDAARPLFPAGDDKALVAALLTTLEQWLMMRRTELEALEWLSFRLPDDLDFANLVELERPDSALPERLIGPPAHLHHRDGFHLTDPRMTRREVLSEVDYCLYCHDRDKDSCSKGLREKGGGMKSNAMGVELRGCPLDEKISEAHYAMRGGDVLAALALVIIDNPMLPGTGHRICNDCMKACVFQKQDPVNIPQIETGVLSAVLELPWGFEIYGLLTRWNPLNVRRPYALPYHGKNVLIVGVGPAGYTLAQHLLNEGFGVVGIDGLKIEPLPEQLLHHPVRDVNSIRGDLASRLMVGFGGVSEYGITVRYDKNFLTLIYATLARRAKARFYGGIRFGGTLTLEDAWKFGFDHVAMAVGAGKPTIIDLENNLIRGIRKASDFLMALQLTGAYKQDTLANLQVRLPAVVIGGGLTAIDAATELRAYYVVQVEKMLGRFEALSAEIGEDRVRALYDEEETGILDEFLAHGRAIRAERDAATAQGRGPVFDALLEEWGGVSLAYRKRLADSPAYRLNHEEVSKALEEGIHFLEEMTPKAAVPDRYGALAALTFTRKDGSLIEIPARSLCVAAGTSPNTVYEKEREGTFARDRRGFFAAHSVKRGDGGAVELVAGSGFFTSYLDEAGHTVSYYGDNHPAYAGSVVKAMASAKDGFRHVVALFAPEIAAALADTGAQSLREKAWDGLIENLEDAILATIHSIQRLTPTIVEVIVRAPSQARMFEPGQFYRLQNFETKARRIDGTKLLMENLALTGAWTNKEEGLISLIVLEMGSSSRLCATLEPGDPVILMGPTGTPTEIPHGESVLLAGGGLGNAVLFSIARALRANGCKVLYFAGYKNPADVFKRDEVEESTDQVIWASDVEPAIAPRRPQDHAFVGNIVEAMVAYSKGDLGRMEVDPKEISRIIVIGSDRMMAAVARARFGVLREYLKPGHAAVGSINSPMQCMLKEVCAQCLQRHIDPATGKPKSMVFSCFNQDQNLDEVDWQNLNDRLRQNSVQEKLTDLWLDRILEKHPDLLRV